MSRFSQFTGGGASTPTGTVVSTLSTITTLSGYLKLDGTCYCCNTYPDLAGIMGPPVPLLTDTSTVTQCAIPSGYCELSTVNLKWGPSRPGQVSLYCSTSSSCCYRIRVVQADGTCLVTDFLASAADYCSPCLASAWFNGCGLVGVSGNCSKYSVLNLCQCCALCLNGCLGNNYDGSPYYRGHQWIDNSFFVDSWAGTNNWCHNLMYICPSGTGVCAKTICGCANNLGTFQTGSSNYNACVNMDSACMVLFDCNGQQCGFLGGFKMPDGYAYNCSPNCCTGVGLMLPFSSATIQACIYARECAYICQTCFGSISGNYCFSSFGVHLGRINETTAVYTRHTLYYYFRSGYSNCSFTSPQFPCATSCCWTVASNTTPCIGFTSGSGGCTMYASYACGGSINGMQGAWITTGSCYTAVGACFACTLPNCFSATQGTVTCVLLAGTSYPVLNTGSTALCPTIRAWGGLRANFANQAGSQSNPTIFAGAAQPPAGVFQVSNVTHPTTGLSYFIKT